MSDQQQLWDMLDDFHVCMATTHDGGTLRSRPMVPRIDRDAGVIRFLTEGGAHKVREVEADHDINLAFAEPRKMEFVSLSGTANISHDRAQVKALWNAYADAWFDGGPEDADVAVVTVRPTQAELWNGESNKIRTIWEIAKATSGSGHPDLGENRKVKL
ncbi:MAG: pyridoxamine oxidase [Alphaproteobacteria bacterium]|nr:pyridoxamine oxidase [Alphaproteobacteria bacterium]